MPGFLFFGYAVFFALISAYLLRLTVMGRRLARERARLLAEEKRRADRPPE